MYSAKIQNSNGNVMLLTGNEAEYQVLNIEGLNPPKAQINTTSVVGLDGALYNSARLETRNIVLTIKINGDVETNRLNLYNYFRTKDWCTFFYSNGNRDVFITGYVESVECNYFTNGEIAQISILCPYPYFKSIDEIITDISAILPSFVFPFSINYDQPIPFSTFDNSRIVNVVNASDSEMGITILIEVIKPVPSITIQNVDTGDEFNLIYSLMAGDEVTINTQRGQKSVSLERHGMTINLFSAVQGSVFFQLRPGSNFFTYSVGGGAGNNVTIKFQYHNIFRGV